MRAPSTRSNPYESCELKLSFPTIEYTLAPPVPQGGPCLANIEYMNIANIFRLLLFTKKCFLMFFFSICFFYFLSYPTNPKYNIALFSKITFIQAVFKAIGGQLPIKRIIYQL